jgi:hypothetical protein
MVKPIALACLVLALGLLVFNACSDSPEITRPSTATATVSHRLTVTGLGTGNGVVTSNRGGINCAITAGTAAATGCTALFSQGVSVTLTARPASGHSFVGWGKACTGTGTCKLTMSVGRVVSAKFLKGPFTIRISSGTVGIGSGRVRSQTGLTPAINCVITNGTPATTGCSARYPAYTQVILTATPADGFVFAGWRESACGTGSCQYTVIQPRTIPVTFARAISGSPVSQGRWAPVFTTPALGIHLHLLPTGKVLFWGFNGDPQIWDPTNSDAGFSAVPRTHMIFCAGHTFDANGRLLVAGGTGPNTRGLRVVTVFDPLSPGWSGITSMAQGRYYPTTTTLADGQILAISGHDTPSRSLPFPKSGTAMNGAG